MKWPHALVPLLLASSACTSALPQAATSDSARETAPTSATVSPAAEPATALTATPTAQATVLTTVAPTAMVSAATPTVARATVAPTAQPPATVPPHTAAYRTLPPGAALPSEQQCASEAVRDPWEPRPQNRTANQNNVWLSGFRLRASYIGTIFPAYEQRVTGNFTGTTNEIFRWAACKWGFDEEDVRAQAVAESTWRQSFLSDCGYTTQPETNGCASMGIMSVKGADIPPTFPGTWPAAWTSTAFNVDYTLALRRLCFEGKETWMRQFNSTYAAGDLWGCIGRWYSGRWHDAGAEKYIADVRAIMNAKPWLSPTF